MAKTDFSAQNGRFFLKNLQDTRKMCIFAIANITERFAPRAVKDARVMTQGIFYVHTSETCQRSHYTNSGGHPVDLSPWTKSVMFSDREGCRFPCHRGDAPGREAGEPGGIKCVGRVPRFSPFLEEYSRRGNRIFPVWEQKTAQGGSLYAKHRSKMQQLTLQFEGFADTQQHIDVGTTKRRSVKLNHLLPGWALLQRNPTAALARVVSNVKLFAQVTLCVLFGFGLVFLSAIIGG